MKRTPKSYQIRMRSNQWHVDFLNNNGEHVRTEGPFKKIDEAQKIADDSGLPDSDKGGLPWHNAGGKNEYPRANPEATS